MPGDEETQHEISFKNITLDTIQMSLVWADTEYIRVEVPETRIGPGERANISVEVNRDRRKDRFEKSFTIQMDDEQNTRMTIPVTFNRSRVPTDRATRSKP
jgi:hypothetical protein